MKCKDCGLLMVRDQITGHARSADEFAREKGAYRSAGSSYVAGFICRVASPTFRGDMSLSSQRVAAESISGDIDCGYFQQWQPGKTAQEHEEMALLEKVREENRRSREDERREREAWRAEDIQIKRDSEAATARRFRWTEIRSWLALIVALLGVCFSAYIAWTKARPTDVLPAMQPSATDPHHATEHAKPAIHADEQK